MLQCDLVKPQEMYKYKWYASSDHQDWYYYIPRKKIDLKLDIDPKLVYKTLDPNLKDIFKLVMSRGYNTLPSCEGHFHSIQDLKHKYKSLIKDALKINSQGMKIKNLENQKVYLYADEDYSLPWNSFEDFKDKVTSAMSTGYFGIINPNIDLTVKNNCFSLQQERINDDLIFHILVNNKSKEEVANNWKRVFSFLKENL